MAASITDLGAALVAAHAKAKESGKEVFVLEDETGYSLSHAKPMGWARDLRAKLVCSVRTYREYRQR